MTLPPLCMAATTSAAPGAALSAALGAASGARRATPGHARRIARAAARPARFRPLRLRGVGGPARPLNAKG